jgi:hypothetical protein
VELLPEAEVLAAELFLELLTESEPGLTLEDLSRIETFLRTIQARGNIRRE